MQQYRSVGATPNPPESIPVTASVPDQVAIPQEPISPAKSKSIWGVVAGAAGFVLMAVGFSEPNVDFLADGFQLAEDLGPALTAAGGILYAVGLRLAKRPVTIAREKIP